MPENDAEDETIEEAGTDRPGRLASWLGRVRARIGGGRAWIAANRFKAVLLAGSVLAVVGGIATVGLYFLLPGPVGPDVTAEMALEALDQREYAEARQRAETLRDRGGLAAEQAGVPAFVLGAAAAGEAEKVWGADRKNLFLVAAAHLEEARSRGFPAGREAEATFLLGKSLCGGGQIAASRPVLRAALELEPRLATEIHHLLAAANLRDAPPKLPEALQENELYLGDRALSASQRRRGLVQRAEILLALGKLAECRETLAKLPAGPPGDVEAAVLSARVLMQEARALKTPGADAERQAKAGGKYQEALQALRQAQGTEGLHGPATEKAAYLTGVCLLETGDQRGALNEFARTRTIYPTTPEAAAADFQEAELLRQMGRDREALAAYRRALRSVVDVGAYDNPWLPTESMRRRTLEAYQHYIDARNWSACLGLAQALTPLFPKDRSVQAQADTYAAWGHDLLAQAEHLGPPKADPLGREGRAHLRRAGEGYGRLAGLRVTAREHPEDVWRSANAYLEGRDYRNAARRFQEYLKVESRSRQAPALTGLGECLLAMDRGDEALAAIEKCITQNPRDVSSFRARVLAGKAAIEKADYQRAERHLEDNLNSDLLTPASKEWRESLFLLGELTYKVGRCAEAVRRLEEAVKRYGDSRPALAARYRIADSYHQNARAESEKLKHELVEAARIARSKRVRESLAAALEQYRQAQEGLLRYQETHELEPLEMALLRNGYFATGSLLVELGQYEAALKAYTTAISRYRSAPEVLDAYLQIAWIHRQTDKPAEARAALEQAKVVLNRMKPQAAFQDTTNYSRPQWTELLDSPGKGAGIKD